MIQGMTGFGSSTVEKGRLSVSVEIRSENGRFLDVSIRTSAGLGSFEDDIRQDIKRELRRGRISVSVSAEQEGLGPDGDVQFDRAQFEAYSAIRDTIQREYGEKINITDVIDIRRLLTIDETVDVDKRLFLGAVRDAIGEVKSMRVAEGRAMAEDMRMRVDHLDRMLNEIGSICEGYMPALTDEYRKKIQDLVTTEGIPAHDPRILQEAAILAAKVDVTEECVRCASHLKQFKNLVAAKDPVGKRMNFLLQEIGREINTIGAKTNQLKITRHVIDMKDETEKLKEQVQNVL